MCHAVSFRDGANYLAVGDILGNVIIIKPTPREFFFKFFDRVLEGSSRFHHILSINVSPKSTHMLISRCDGTIFVFKEFIEVVSVMSVLENLELVSQAKKVPKKTSKSPPKTPGKKSAVDGGATAILNQNAARDDEDDESNDVSKMAKVMDQIKLFQLHNELIMRPSNAAPVHCCSISDAGM
jgi:hypothetical protein